MSELWIEGGKPLRGRVWVQGSKNAALPCMAAACLTEEICVLKGCPKISDIYMMEKILNSLGAVTLWKDGDLYLDGSGIRKQAIPASYASSMRSSIVLLGPLLGRNHCAEIMQPGGCAIGERPVDLHLELVRKMGGEIKLSEGLIQAEADTLKACVYSFPKVSVGATEQGILLAVSAEGETVLKRCAKEPEIVCLCQFLKNMGADIRGEGTEEIHIHGRKQLSGAGIQIPADRIVAGTYLCACAATRGEIVLEHAPIDQMDAVLRLCRKIGGQFEIKSGKLIADCHSAQKSFGYLETKVYPGFPTDLQSPVMALASFLDGNSRIYESVFENRFRVADELRSMGAEIIVYGREAEITGNRRLKGCEVTAGELRGGAALVIAALAAEGLTRVKGYSFIQRGYENICRDVTALGGRIWESTGI